ncbi:MAG: glycosyltransferase family 2 protein [Melioribacter sp.]|nr:glycosyltransferase family 2 protein [Melioribacter sp.]
MNLSAIVIAKDEEKNIRYCLDSLQSVVDDIVVLIDSRTKDKTQQIVSEYTGINYEIVEWQGYGLTKNYALSKTKYDWVLWVDADERLSKELAEELNDFKKTNPLYNSYFIARRSYFLGKWIKHCGWYPDYVLRLFNKNYAKFNEKLVHENLIVEGKSGYLKNDIIHNTDPTIHHYFEKFNLYTSLAAEELYTKNVNVSLLDILLRPIFVFIKMYFLKLGFLDGLHGFVLSSFSAFYVFTKYCKLKELYNNFKR